MIAPRGPILAATDFSGHARHAAARAASLAHETQAPLTLMHVWPDAPLAQIRAWLAAENAPVQRTRGGAKSQLRQLQTELSSARPIDVTIEDAAGSALKEIQRTADRLDARLVVLGARGSCPLRRLVLGTTSVRLIRRLERPLLVVRQRPRESYRRALVAVDFSASSHNALALARNVAPTAHLVLMTVFQVPFEEKLRFAGVNATTIEIYRQQARAGAIQRMHTLAREAGLLPSQWEPCILEGDASLRVVEQERLRRCDLVVMGHQSHPSAVDLLFGSVTRQVLAWGQVDLLVSTALNVGPPSPPPRRRWQ